MNFDFDFGVEQGIATITLNRPQVLNAITLDIYAQLRDLFAALEHDNSVRVVIITGTGRGFCSGGDVNEIIGALLDRDMRDHLEFCRMTGHLVRNMRLLTKPIVAAINGLAAGAGSVIACQWVARECLTRHWARMGASSCALVDIDVRRRRPERL